MSDNNVCASSLSEAWAKLAKPLLAAQVEANALGKDSRNEYQGYNYTSAEDIIIESRRCLHKNGLALVKEGWDLLVIGEDEMAMYAVTATYTLVHKDGASVMCTTTYPVCPAKGRPADKAVNASLTTGLAYFLRDLLLIPRCDEEVDARADSVTARGRSAIRSTPTPTRKSGSNKQKFMEGVALWIGHDVGEPEVTEACLAVLKVNNMPTDGSCSPTQFGELTKWVKEQMAEGVDHATMLAEPAT